MHSRKPWMPTQKADMTRKAAALAVGRTLHKFRTFSIWPSVCFFSITAFVLILVPEEVKAQVVINEVFNNPAGKEDGAEWVELYNLSTSPLSLDGCTLFLDDSASTQKIIFAEEDFVEKFKVISWDKSWLNNNGDQVSLECPGNLESIAYGNLPGSLVGAPQEGFSFGKFPDGQGNYFLLSSVTLGSPNSAPPTPTPPPTVTPTPSPKPTNTSTPPPTLKVTAINTPNPSITTSPPESKNEVLGFEDETEEEIINSKPGDEVTLVADSKNDLSEEEVKSKKPPFLALLLIVSGVVLTCVSFYSPVKKLLKRYNLKDESETEK